MYKRGFVIGKFYPPHRGHKYLIDTAQSQCGELTIAICSKQSEWIPGDLRAQWLKHIHPRARVIHIKDDMPGDNDSQGWARFTKDLLGYTPDAVFTSEDYGDRYARFMETTHVLVDKERVTVPISGTKVRSNPLAHLTFLEPSVRAHFVKRICSLGAESTGTTTLARELADYYQTVWVPEFGRLYSEGKTEHGGAWRSEEFLMIAQSQAALEDMLAQSAHRLIVCDTDPFATGLWHERYMGSRSNEVEACADSRKYDLYILTGDEIPFVQDGLRDGEHIRHAMHQRFIERLKETGRKYILVTGSKEERLKQATVEIEKILRE